MDINVFFFSCLLGTRFHWGGYNTAAELTSLVCW